MIEEAGDGGGGRSDRIQTHVQLAAVDMLGICVAGELGKERIPETDVVEGLPVKNGRLRFKEAEGILYGQSQIVEALGMSAKVIQPKGN